MTKEVKNLMELLGITEQEALDIISCDKKIDKGEKLFELDENQKKTEKKMRQADRKPFVPKLEARERKPNEPKRELISAIEEMLSCSDLQADNVAITNPERQIDFTYKGTKYRIVLSAPRK